MKPKEFSFSAYGVREGAKLDVVFKGIGYYPPACRGVVEKVYPRFAVLKTKHFRVTCTTPTLLRARPACRLRRGRIPS